VSGLGNALSFLRAADRIHSLESVQVKAASPRRVGVDREANEFVVFDETHPGKSVYHGHVRTWQQLTPEMKNALIRAGRVTKSGKIK
jgi:hypothetical protein